jgi:hypothetical protein
MLTKQMSVKGKSKRKILFTATSRSKKSSRDNLIILFETSYKVHRVFTKFRKFFSDALLKATMSFVCPYGTIRLPVVGFPLNLIVECFSKNCPKNSSFIKVWHE